MQLLRSLLRRTPLYSALKAWRARRIRRQWEQDGHPLPAPGVVKEAILRDYAQRYPVSVFVETGTLYGDSTEAMRHEPFFVSLHSIELDPFLAAEARQRFHSHPEVQIHEGDSATVLPNILKSLSPSTAALFWLDGHYSGQGTARAGADTPIRRELGAILSHPCRQHVILIDDARHFVGLGDYPTIEEVFKTVSQYRPGACVRVEHDIIRVEPV